MLCSEQEFSSENIEDIKRYEAELSRDGYAKIRDILNIDELNAIHAAVDRLQENFPHGFVNNGVYATTKPEPRRVAPLASDYAPTIIYPNVGFMEPSLLAPLANPILHALIAGVVGEDYYLSNTWLQLVPPGTGRMAYHKDPRGSITFVLMLDEIGEDMGSTCLVPGSHLNTPPASFCMKDIQKQHGREIDITGKVGDIVLFSPETWHARAPNFGKSSTRRLFYNFYSRSSKNTTSWKNGVADDEVMRAQMSLPEKYRTIFKVDPAVTSLLQNTANSKIELLAGSKSHDHLFSDILHSYRVYGKSCKLEGYPGHIKPYTIRHMELRKFSIIDYIGHMAMLPTLKNVARAIIGKQIDAIRGLMRY